MLFLCFGDANKEREKERESERVSEREGEGVRERAREWEIEWEGRSIGCGCKQETNCIMYLWHTCTHSRSAVGRLKGPCVLAVADLMTLLTGVILTQVLGPVGKTTWLATETLLCQSD